MARVQFLLFLHTFNFRGLRSFDLVKNRVGSVWVRFSSENGVVHSTTTTVNMNLWFLFYGSYQKYRIGHFRRLVPLLE